MIWSVLAEWVRFSVTLHQPRRMKPNRVLSELERPRAQRRTSAGEPKVVQQIWGIRSQLNRTKGGVSEPQRRRWRRGSLVFPRWCAPARDDDALAMFSGHSLRYGMTCRGRSYDCNHMGIPGNRFLCAVAGGLPGE